MLATQAIWKVSPEIRCRIQPKSRIPKGGTGGFTVAAVLGEAIGTASGTSGGFIAGLPLLNPTASRSWDATSTVLRVGQALEFVRFQRDGRVYFGASAQDAAGEDEVSGFMLRVKETPLDNSTGSDGANAELLAGLAQNIWSVLSGDWRGVMHGGEGQARGLVNVGAQGSARAQSGTLAANLGTRWTITGQGLRGTGTNATNGVHGLHVRFADGLYGAVLQHGKPPRFTKWINGEYVDFAPLRGATNVDLRAGVSQVLRFFRLDGRLIVGWQGQFWWVAECETAQAAQANDAARMVEVAWPEGVASVEAIGVRARVELGVIEFDGDADEEDRQLVLDAGALNYPYQGDGVAGIATGYLKYGSASVQLTSSENRGYATLTINAGSENRDTPIVNKITGQFPDEPYDAGSGGTFDASNAVRRASLEMAYPPQQAGANLSITFDRKHLTRLAAAEGVNWGDYLHPFCVVTWEARWRYSDNSAGPWTGFFKGIGAKVDSGTSGVNEQHLTLTCFDPVFLLQEPAAMLDHSYPPLDVFWLHKLRQSNSQSAVGSGPYNPYNPPAVGGLPQNVESLSYTGEDAVRDILWLFRGPEAQRLHADLGELYPLLGSEEDAFGYCRAEQVASGDGQPVSVNGWCLPPPDGGDALGWIEDVCEKLNAIFFYGWLAGDDYTDWPRPILTTWERLLANRPTHVVADTIFDTLGEEVTPEWVNKTMSRIERESRPDATINHVEATSTGFYGDAMEGSGRPPRIAEARLPVSDHNSEENIRHRRSLIRDVGALGGFPGGVEAYVFELIYQFAIDKEPAWPTITLPEGRAYYPGRETPTVIGDKLRTEFGSSEESDTGLGLDNAEFRIGTVRHDWEVDGSNRSWTSDIGVRPLSGTGL